MEGLPIHPVDSAARRVDGADEVTSSRAALLAPSEDVPAPARQEPARFHSRSRRRASRWTSWGSQLVALLAIGWSLCFHVSEVRGHSMQPTLAEQDRIVVDEVSHRVAGLERGDVVVMRFPGDPRIRYVKRVVGLPGEEVVILAGTVFIDGQALGESYLGSRHADLRDSHGSVLLGPDEVYVLGDNRGRSSDSREFGPVHRDLVIGTVQARVWPFARLAWRPGT